MGHICQTTRAQSVLESRARWASCCQSPDSTPDASHEVRENTAIEPHRRAVPDHSPRPDLG